jgi:aryl-alcohol dehydrogenase-like predicted oxidoreductase
LLQRREVTAPIIGPRTLEQLEGASLRATEIELDDDALKAINEIFPGPGKAPEAYAW